MLIGDDESIIAGHGRVEAAKLLGRKTVSTLKLSHLNNSERRAYILADNKLALNAGWDNALLALELQGLLADDFDLELTGFNIAEIDFIIEDAESANPQAGDLAYDAVPQNEDTAATRMGDLWLLGRYKLVCGDAQDIQSFQRLPGNEQGDLLFTDPPYNVKIDGNVCGLGSVKHREFAFASGEMSEDEFKGFPRTTLGNNSNLMRDGSIAYVCMDWRHMGEMLATGKAAFTELKDLAVWNKSNGGMYKLHMMPLRWLRKLAGDRQEHSEFMKCIAGVGDGRGKETYKTVNSIMKPLRKPQGYRSLAEFEHAFEKDGENLPWPKIAAT